MEEVDVTPPEQIGCFSLSRSQFSVKDIFTDNHNWDRYYYVHRREVRPVEREEVEKMMGWAAKAQIEGVTFITVQNAASTIASHLAATADYARIAASGTRINGQRGSAVGCSVCRTGMQC